MKGNSCGADTADVAVCDTDALQIVLMHQNIC